MQSLAVIQALRPSRIYPGHGPVVTDPETHVQMYIDNRNNREQQILSALASDTAQQLFTTMDLVEIIYTVIEVFYYSSELQCIGWLIGRAAVLCKSSALTVSTSILLYTELDIVSVFKPPPPVGAGGGYMFLGRPSVPLSVRPSVRPWFTWWFYVSAISPVSVDGFSPNFCHWCTLGHR